MNINKNVRQAMLSVWNVEEMTGYKPMTTFWQDFSIADCYGEAAVRDTYDRAFEEWKSDYKYLTELVMVLNHKLWYHHERGNALANVYNELWKEADEYAGSHLHSEEMSYFYSVTD